MKIAFPSRSDQIENPCRFHLKHKARLCLHLKPGEAFRADTPTEWVAPNGLLVRCNPSGWDGSYHDAHYWPEWAWATVYHRHLGPARRALKAFVKEFLTNTVSERARLRALVRAGD